MTHTPGFAETAKYLIDFGEKHPEPLGQVLSRAVPDRIYAPGTMPAYSNYGASVAGYIVERVSGEPFDAYVQRHIFAPLGMTHSTFDQPLPPKLRPLHVEGLQAGLRRPAAYEVIAHGAGRSAGVDRRRHGQVHDRAPQQRRPLLNPATAQLMHATANKPYSGAAGDGARLLP